jgi:hypothetical protein
VKGWLAGEIGRAVFPKRGRGDLFFDRGEGLFLGRGVVVFLPGRGLGVELFFLLRGVFFMKRGESKTSLGFSLISRQNPQSSLP